MPNNARTKVAVFDIDGTIFRSSLLIQFNKGLIQMGVVSEKHMGDFLDAYYAWVERRGKYTTYLNRVVSMHARAIRGKDRRYIQAVADLVFLRHRNRVYRYTRDLVKKLRPTHRLLAISGSPIEVVQQFGDHFGFDRVWGSVYGVDAKGHYTGKHTDIRSVDRKVDLLKEYLRKEKLSLKGSIGVGDTESDLSILEAVEQPIVFNPSNRLFAIAKQRHWPIVVERKDVIYRIEV